MGQQFLCCPACGYPYVHRMQHREMADSLCIGFHCDSCGDGAKFALAITNLQRGVVIEWKEL
jgi:hypothetical protein